MAVKIHEIAKDVAITSKGVVLAEGQEVTVEDFASEEVFASLVKAGKIVEVTKTEKKSEEKKSETPSSSTGAAESQPENTKPKK